MKTNMAGEGDRHENLSFTNPNSACNFNLSRLRERVKEYIDKVKHLCLFIFIYSENKQSLAYNSCQHRPIFFNE